MDSILKGLGRIPWSWCPVAGICALCPAVFAAGQSGSPAAPEAASAQSEPASAPGNSKAQDALEEVVVSGIRASLKSSLDVKRKADQVIDAISAEDIGQFPDKNLSEALQRVTGVQINRQDGEGRGVSIRGADPSLNRVEINGSEALSLTVGGGRDVDFRDIPVEFVNRIEVVKSATPDMTEGGVGGTVRVVTRRPFDSLQPYLAGSAQMVYSNLAQSRDPKFALIGSRTFFDNTLGLLLSATYEKRHLNNNESRTTGWLMRTDSRASGIQAFVPDIPREVINRRLTTRPAFNGIVEWRPTSGLDLYAEGTWAYAREEVASQFMQLSGSSGVVDATKTQIGPDNTVLHYEVVDSPANRLALAYRNILGHLIRKQYTSALGGDWDAQHWKADGKVSYSLANVYNAERDATASIVGLPRAIVDYNNPQHAPNFTFPGIDTRTSQGVTQLDAVYVPRTNVANEISGRFNLEYRPASGWLNSLKTGVEAYRLTMDQTYFGATVTLNGLTNPALLPQIHGILDQYSRVNDVPYFETGDLGYAGGIRYWLDNRDAVFDSTGNPQAYNSPRLLDTWNVRERTVDAYLQSSFSFPSLSIPISGVLGVRAADTRTLSTGYNVTTRSGTSVYTPGSQNGGYRKYLPSLNMRFDLTHSLQARLAAGKVMARASPADLALRRSIDIVGLTGSRGNPDLKPFEARQYDLGLEWYISSDSYLSGALFRKEISSFILNLTAPEEIDGVIYSVRRPVNGTEGVTINGIEAGGQYVFAFLPGPFQGFGALANFTYQKDQGYRGTDFFTHGALPFPGLSRKSANASVFYENPRWSIRLSYNWRDRYLITPQGRGNNPEFGEAYGQLDGSLTVNISRNASFFLEGINLTDEVRIEDASSLQRRTDIETFGSRYFAGVRVRF